MSDTPTWEFAVGISLAKGLGLPQASLLATKGGGMDEGCSG